MGNPSSLQAGSAGTSSTSTSGTSSTSSDNGGKNVHTVSFVMSDGDNVQWMFNTFATTETWYGASTRGKVPVGWTVAPALAKLAPTILRDMVSKLTANDELVAGPSGAGYTYPQKWPATLADDYAELTAEETAQWKSMRLWNILGQNDDEPTSEELSPFLQVKNGTANDGLIYYGYGDGYSSQHGKIWWFAGKPVVSGRYSLWGEDKSGDMVGGKTMIEYLKKMSKDPSKPEGYSVIPVGAWSHSYADIVTVVEALEKEGGFEVVLPSELVARVKKTLVGKSAEESIVLV